MHIRVFDSPGNCIARRTILVLRERGWAIHKHKFRAAITAQENIAQGEACKKKKKTDPVTAFSCPGPGFDVEKFLAQAIFEVLILLKGP